MRKLQKLSMAAVLTLMLATGAFAGIIQTGEAPPAPPDPPAPGIIQTGIAQTPSDPQNSPAPSDALAEIALSLLQDMLSVF
jgi:hypothetical protein